MVLSVATFKPLIKLAETTRLPFLENANTLLPIEETHLKVVLPAWSVSHVHDGSVVCPDIQITSLLLPVSLFWLAWYVSSMFNARFSFSNISHVIT